MHLLYVDESGDTGRHNPENHTFVLCGLMVHHADWHEAQAALGDMRQRLRTNFSLPMEAEIHASELLGRSPHHFKLDRMQRVKIALHVLEAIREQSALTPMRVSSINVQPPKTYFLRHGDVCSALPKPRSTTHGT